MIVIAVLCVLVAGLACLGMCLVGIRSYVGRRDWHFIVGAGLYGFSGVALISWIFSLGW